MIGGLDIYWTTNPEWTEYYINSSGKECVRLTDKATPEAIESFNRYFERMKEVCERERKMGPGAHIV